MNTDDSFEIIAEEYSKKVKDKVYYEIRPSECPIKRSFCRKYERTIVDNSKVKEIYKEIIQTIAKNKSVSEDEAEKLVCEFLGINNADNNDVIIPENYQSCKYLKSNGLGNEDGILYIECGCNSKSLKFICDEE